MRTNFFSSIFADNGEFYPGYPGYGDYFPDGQGGPGGVSFLPPNGAPGMPGDQMHPGKHQIVLPPQNIMHLSIPLVWYIRHMTVLEKNPKQFILFPWGTINNHLCFSHFWFASPSRNTYWIGYILASGNACVILCAFPNKKLSQFPC